MKIWKIAKRIIKYALLILIVVIVYFRLTAVPIYEGRFTVDINNTTSQYIEGAVIEYEAVGESVTLPTVKPYERLIVVMPKKIGDKPQRSRVFLKYNGITEEILGEFHILTGATQNTEVGQFAKAKIDKDGINDIKLYFSDKELKPYFRIIDMDKE